uniref:Uncharacterized protein n=1 Tax=Schistosoma haematobium TaxID=6185 RepID=A0A094ZLA4_SCHHA
MGLNNYEQKDLLRRIKEWNATRLDLFKISEPNKLSNLKNRLPLKKKELNHLMNEFS